MPGKGGSFGVVANMLDGDIELGWDVTKLTDCDVI